MRAFVAIPAPPLAVEGSPEGRTQNAPAHLTLRFFEELDPTAFPAVQGALDRTAAGTFEFRLVLEGVGAFPNAHSPRVVWVGVGEGREAVMRLESRLRDELASVGFPPESRPFAPHLTLLRVRNGRDREAAGRLLADSGGRRFGETIVRELLLKESELTRSGAVHRVVHRVAFAPAPTGY
jgi:2'-5' RNA ligase